MVLVDGLGGVREVGGPLSERRQGRDGERGALSGMEELDNYVYGIAIWGGGG